MYNCKESECQNKKINFGGCCYECKEKDKCEWVCMASPKTCGDSVFLGEDLEIFTAATAGAINVIKVLMIQKDSIEKQEKEMREALKKSMEEHNVKSYADDTIEITYIEETTRETIDSKRLKIKYPQIADECTKVSSVKPSVRIKLL